MHTTSKREEKTILKGKHAEKSHLFHLLYISNSQSKTVRVFLFTAALVGFCALFSWHSSLFQPLSQHQWGISLGCGECKASQRCTPWCSLITAAFWSKWILFWYSWTRFKVFIKYDYILTAVRNGVPCGPWLCSSGDKWGEKLSMRQTMWLALHH